MAKVPIKVTVNGVEHSLDVEPRLLLVHLLREPAGPLQHTFSPRPHQPEPATRPATPAKLAHWRRSARGADQVP